MANLTDPARELADISIRLSKGTSASGADFLATEFEVPAWSTEFIKIIGCILERADLVIATVRSLDMDEDHKQSAIDDISGFKSAFVGSYLNTAWNHSGAGLTLMKDHGKPLQYLSRSVREKVNYPLLSSEEVDEMIQQIDLYLSELAMSDEGPDFVRQAIWDGLQVLLFQLRHMKWTGAGYTLLAFREVNLVMEAVKTEYAHGPATDPQRILTGLAGLLKSFKAKLDTAKGYSDAAEFAWKAYSIGSRVATPILLTGHVPLLPNPF